MRRQRGKLGLEFKSGELAEEEKKDFKHELRKYVTGFANAEGGLLVIGPSDEPPRTISPLKVPGRQRAVDWVSDILQQEPHFVRPPRVRSQTYKKKKLIFVSTMPSNDFVPVVEKRRMEFWMRIWHRTVQVPDFLLADIKLGRRSHPDLELRDDAPVIGCNSRRPGQLSVIFFPFVENLGLSHADDVRVGIVSWDFDGEHAPTNRNLGRSLDAIFPDVQHHERYHFVHQTSHREKNKIEIGPFENKKLGSMSFHYWVGDTLDWGVEAQVAIYLLARGHPPIWYQASFMAANERELLLQKPQVKQVEEFELKKLEGKLPVVSLKSRRL